MRNIIVSFVVLMLSGCGLKYESFVEGSAPKPETVQAAVNDLIDVFDRSDVTADNVRLYPAEGDRIMRALLERRLRSSGYAVSDSKPVSVLSAPIKEKADTNTVTIRYRASFVDGIGTFCLVITGEKKMLCRMYNAEGEPLSSVTHRGIRVEQNDSYRPTDLRLEQPPDENTEIKASSARLDQFQQLQQHKPFAPVSPDDLVTYLTESDVEPDKSISEEIKPVVSPRYRPLPIELLRKNLERFIAALDEDSDISIATSRLIGESDREYRTRLLRYMDDANQYMRTGVVSGESTLRVSSND